MGSQGWQLMELAGGYQIGDRVFVGGALGTVLGPPARQIAARLSVTVRYDDGTTADVRAANLTLVDESATYNATSDAALPSAVYDTAELRAGPAEATDLAAGVCQAEAEIGVYPHSPDSELAVSGHWNGVAAGDNGGFHQGGDVPYAPDMDRAPRGTDDMEAPKLDMDLGEKLGALNELLAECGAGLQLVDEDFELNGRQDESGARRRIAEIESRARAIEGVLADMTIPTSRPALENFKRDVVLHLEQILMQVDFISKKLHLVPAAPNSTSRPNTAARAATSSSMRSTAQTLGEEAAEPLAGGFVKGDRVMADGELGTVVGGPARAACARLSVSVHFDIGHVSDVRATNLQRVPT